MRFGILGPLEVWDGDEPLALGGPQQRQLLAVLLLNANQVVSAERLIEHLWGTRAPASARQLLKGCVLGLRRALRVGRAERLLTRPPGYLLQVRPGECDLDLAEELAAAAVRHRDGPAEETAELLREALALWRGPVLDGLDAEVCRTEAERLAERRLTLLEERIEVELGLGRCRALVAELQTLVREHPLRERLWAQLVLALHGADRQADALTAYRRIRQSLVDQLGVEPGAVLRRAHRLVLTGESGEAGPVRVRRRAVPAQLPAEVPGFVGRDEELAELDRLADRGVLLISGTAGVGKSALATRWAHRVRDRFPDGQLHLDLRGHAPGEPVTTASALTTLLTALGLAAHEIPADEAGLAACFRTEVAGRRLVLVLDDASSTEQVRPLLPGTSTCVTVVTSRDTLAGLVVLDGAHRLDLGRLPESDAIRLLHGLIGDRVAAEAATLADHCARLPLALRIVAELAATRALPDLVAALGDPRERLDLLETGDDERASVREALSRSYQRLPGSTARMFRCIGRSDVLGVDVTGAAALTGTSLREARRDLGRLLRANLIHVTPDGRYAMHGLLRDYATHRAPTTSTPNTHPLAAR